MVQLWEGLLLVNLSFWKSPMHHEYKTIKHELICLFENKTIQELADDLVGGDAFLSNKK